MSTREPAGKQRPPDGPRRRPSYLRLLVALAATLAALGACELLVRALPAALTRARVPDFEWMAYDSRLGMVNVPGTYARPRITRAAVDGTFLIGDDGFRASLHGDEAPSAEPRPRIVCMGDSSTFGIWLASGVAWQEDAVFRADNAYPEILARLMPRADVVNAGVLGYNSGHGLRQLRLQLAALEPAAIVVRYGFNDHAFADPNTHVRDSRSPLLAGAFYGVAASRLFTLALARYRLEARFVAPAQFGWNLEQLVASARARAIDVLFVDYPLRPLALGMTPGEAMPFLGSSETLDGLHERHERYQAIVRDVAARTGAVMVTTRDAFERSAEPPFGAADLVHPNPTGARIVAERVAEVITGRALTAGR